MSGSRLVTDEDLLSLKERLQKDRSDQTAVNWRRFLGELVDFLGHHNMNQVTKEDAQRFRDHLLDKVKVSRTKVRIGCVAGLFELGVEEDLLNLYPFKGSNAHSLRHHAATSMKDVGFSDFIIGSALGHFKGSTMTSTYGSVDLEKVRAAIEAIS